MNDLFLPMNGLMMRFKTGKFFDWGDSQSQKTKCKTNNLPIGIKSHSIVIGLVL